MPSQLTPEGRAWQEKLNALTLDELPRVRATAKEWTGSIAAVTGLLAIVSLVKGRENIEDLSSDWSRYVYVALIAALVVALVAIIAGALAAQGFASELGSEPSSWRRRLARLAGPNVQPGPYPPSWRGLRGFNEAEAAIARALMTWSRLAAAAAGGLLIFAVGATWLGPTDDATAAVTVLVVRDDGTFACGDLAKSGSSGEVAVVEKKGKPATEIAVTKILSVTSASSCP